MPLLVYMGLNSEIRRKPETRKKRAEKAARRGWTQERINAFRAGMGRANDTDKGSGKGQNATRGGGASDKGKANDEGKGSDKGKGKDENKGKGNDENNGKGKGSASNSNGKGKGSGGWEWTEGRGGWNDGGQPWRSRGGTDWRTQALR